MNFWLRIVRYYTVGFAGALVQIAILAFCIHVVRMDYRVATIVALALTLTHNFAWHAAWTWGDRKLTGKGVAVAFAGFVTGNGLVSLVSTVVLMPVFVEIAHVTPVVANLGTIVAGGLVNFWLASRSFRSAARVSLAVGSRTHSIVPQSGV